MLQQLTPVQAPPSRCTLQRAIHSQLPTTINCKSCPSESSGQVVRVRVVPLKQGSDRLTSIPFPSSPTPTQVLLLLSTSSIKDCTSTRARIRSCWKKSMCCVPNLLRHPCTSSSTLPSLLPMNTLNTTLSSSSGICKRLPSQATTRTIRFLANSQTTLSAFPTDKLQPVFWQKQTM